MSQVSLQTIREAFDHVASRNDAWFEANPHAYASDMEALRRFFPVHGAGVFIVFKALKTQSSSLPR